MNRKATSGRGAVPTVEQISLDCITQEPFPGVSYFVLLLYLLLANQYWAPGEGKKAYKPQIVDDICRKELEGCKYGLFNCAHIVPNQRKSRSSQRTTVPPTTAQSNSRANSADAVQMTQYAAMPTETLCLLSSQPHLVQSGPRHQLIARL
ncbi:uncharacterized protein [Montipora capricornis]|uniref:uncharacterized protein isoform X2 n=1 Tax=Montipora capricornis TaxID=246305 RepID=UPI0035F189D4